MEDVDENTNPTTTAKPMETKSELVTSLRALAKRHAEQNDEAAFVLTEADIQSIATDSPSTVEKLLGIECLKNRHLPSSLADEIILTLAKNNQRKQNDAKLANSLKKMASCLVSKHRKGEAVILFETDIRRIVTVKQLRISLRLTTLKSVL